MLQHRAETIQSGQWLMMAMGDDSSDELEDGHLDAARAGMDFGCVAIE